MPVNFFKNPVYKGELTEPLLRSSFDNPALENRPTTSADRSTATSSRLEPAARRTALENELRGKIPLQADKNEGSAVSVAEFKKTLTITENAKLSHLPNNLPFSLQYLSISTPEQLKNLTPLPGNLRISNLETIIEGMSDEKLENLRRLVR